MKSVDGLEVTPALHSRDLQDRRERAPISAQRLHVEFGGYSTAGIKSVNQDAFAAHSPEGAALDLKGVVAALADGLSTSSRSDEASQLAVTHFVHDYFSTPDSWSVREAASRVLNGLNSWMYSSGSADDARALVTTFTCVVFKSTVAHVFHIGDTRLYLYRSGSLEQITQDHHTAARGGVSLTRALGAQLRLQVDYQRVDLATGDLLLLSTDGVHEVLTDAQISGLLSEATDGQSLEQKAERIANHALQAGSEDNISCLLLDVVQLPQESIDDAHNKLAGYVVPPVLQAGNKIDQFVVTKVLYSGTRSHLYLVQDTSRDDAEVLVLKAPSANFSDDPQYLEAFLREQWVGLRVNHAGLMRAFARPVDTPFLYNLFEYIDGTDLRQWMLDHPQPSLTKVREITSQIINALRALQRQGMVHRDLKPENVLVCDNGDVKLIDFGTMQVAGLVEATLVHEHYPVGSVNYIAPEYLLGKDGSYQSDLFSLGVIVYEMISGALPFKPRNNSFRPTNLTAWSYQSIRETRSDVPVWIDLCLRKAVQPNPSKRYEALSEFMTDLSNPNQSMLKQHNQGPLLERNPLLFWQLLSGLLFVVIIAQWVSA